MDNTVVVDDDAEMGFRECTSRRQSSFSVIGSEFTQYKWYRLCDDEGNLWIPLREGKEDKEERKRRNQKRREEEVNNRA
jgi:hypothetical protein